MPKYPNKYLGDPTKIIYRSEWERKVMYFCDMTPGVIQWSSERIAVPYISPLDIIKENLKPESERRYNDPPYRNYYIDFTIKIKTKDGKITTWLVEVKPRSQTKAPAEIKGKQTRKKLTNLNKDRLIYLINEAKFKAASAYAKARGANFYILTENEKGIFTIG